MRFNTTDLWCSDVVIRQYVNTYFCRWCVTIFTVKADEFVLMFLCRWAKVQRPAVTCYCVGLYRTTSDIQSTVCQCQQDLLPTDIGSSSNIYVSTVPLKLMLYADQTAHLLE